MKETLIIDGIEMVRFRKNDFMVNCWTEVKDILTKGPDGHMYVDPRKVNGDFSQVVIKEIVKYPWKQIVIGGVVLSIACICGTVYVCKKNDLKLSDEKKEMILEMRSRKG